MSYQYWLDTQADPSLAVQEPIKTGFRKKHKPAWLEKKEHFDQLREEIGDAAFNEMERNYQKSINQIKQEVL